MPEPTYNPEVHARLVWLWEQGRPRRVQDDPGIDDTGSYCVVWPEDQGSSVHHPVPMLLVFYGPGGFDLVTLDDAPIQIDALPSGLLMDVTEPTIVLFDPESLN
jgi:hypothetical protein